MPRPLGRRNPDYEEKRDRLIHDLTEYVLRSELTRPSFRQLAMAGQVAEPTLRHYFGDRETVASEILRVLGGRAEPLIKAVAPYRHIMILGHGEAPEEFAAAVRANPNLAERLLAVEHTDRLTEGELTALVRDRLSAAAERVR